jgi:GT2 family glycosyltransferase
MSAARVFIGVPTYNRVQSLERALRSALDQDYPHLEIFVSDNASTDGTQALCLKVAASDPRLRYSRNPENLGGAANFKLVFERAEGEFFMWLADDDWLDPGFVSRCVAVLQARPEVVVAGGAGRYYENGRWSFDGDPTDCASRHWFLRVLQYYRSVYDNAIFYGIMRLDCVRRVRWPRSIGSDWMFMAAMAFQGALRTIDGPKVHRSMGGVSETRGRQVRQLGLPWWQAYVPMSFTFPVYAARDVLANPVYESVPRVPRAGFAIALALWIVAIKPVQALVRRAVHGRR